VNVSEVVDGMKTKGYVGDPEALWLFSSISMVRMRKCGDILGSWICEEG